MNQEANFSVLFDFIFITETSCPKQKQWETNLYLIFC